MESRVLAAPLAATRAVSRCSATRRRQCLAATVHHFHTSSSRAATPYPGYAGQGLVDMPPPPPPEPYASASEDRLLRRRKQAELLQHGRNVQPNPKKPITALQKRFWKDVSVKETEAGLQVLLDTRPVRTAEKKVLIIPDHKHHLATAVALEWDNLISAHQALKYHYIPLTSLISRALDLEAADAQGDTKLRDGITAMLIRYFTTDTLLCWAPEHNIHDPAGGPAKGLRQQQAEVATSIISHLTSRVWPGVEINPVLDPDSIMPALQPPMTQEIIRGWVTGLKAWDLAGLERAVLATKSLLAGVRLLVDWSPEFADLRRESKEPRFRLEDAAYATSLEVNWQTSKWGEVDDTHDVEKEDLKRQLGCVVLLVSGESA